MAKQFQVTFDSADPRALGGFWAEVLGYVEEAPPAGFATWPEALAAWGLPPERHNDAYALVDPDGAGPRVFLQKVPEGKTAKNRVHLDVRATGTHGPGEGKAEQLRHESDRLVAIGAIEVEEISTATDHFVVMRDPRATSSASPDALPRPCAGPAVAQPRTALTMRENRLGAGSMSAEPVVAESRPVARSGGRPASWSACVTHVVEEGVDLGLRVATSASRKHGGVDDGTHPATRTAAEPPPAVTSASRVSSRASTAAGS